MLKAAAALWCLLGQSEIGDVRRLRSGPVSFELPVTWRATGGGDTQQFSSSEGDAFVLLDVSEVKRAGGMPAEECLQKIISSFRNPDLWKRTRVGDAPAARRVTVEFSPRTGASTRTDRFVGCNGRTTWALTFFIPLARWTRLGPIADHAFRSLEYVTPSPEDLDDRVGRPQ